VIVRILCEDYRSDQYVARPLIKAMLTALGRPRARVEIIRDPLLGSVTAALDWRRIEPILDRYRAMTSMFILLVDRDGNAHRIEALQNLEDKARLLQNCVMFGENAWQEIEVWALAGQLDLPGDWSWADVRSDPHPKETYFEPYVRMRGLEETPGRGRQMLGREAARRYTRVRQLCSEDVAHLETRLEAFLAAS